LKINDSLSLEDWENFSKTETHVKDFPFNDTKISKWIDKEKKRITSTKQSIKLLIEEFVNIWRNQYYQRRSQIINEATFTHDLLVPILKFVAPFYFKRWDQAQSFSSKERGVLKYVDVVGSVESNDHLFELLFTEVSHGPFHPNPE
jgi:hypothetical protein